MPLLRHSYASCTGLSDLPGGDLLARPRHAEKFSPAPAPRSARFDVPPLRLWSAGATTRARCRGNPTALFQGTWVATIASAGWSVKCTQETAYLPMSSFGDFCQEAEIFLK